MKSIAGCPVTRILYAKCDRMDLVEKICAGIGFIRHDLWQRFGAIKHRLRTLNELRGTVTRGQFYKGIAIDGTIKNESVKDIINDILANREAAKKAIIKKIYQRISDVDERKRLCELLSENRWTEDNRLHRWMRKACPHGVGHCTNQFVVRSDKFTMTIEDGTLVVYVRLAKPRGIKDAPSTTFLRLVTNSTGKGVNLNSLGHSNLRIILGEDGRIGIHYCTIKPEGRPCGKGELGADFGYARAATDELGRIYGPELGDVLTEYSDKLDEFYRGRNRLWARAKYWDSVGRHDKAERIRKNNLGQKKIARLKKRYQQKIKNIIYKAVHAIIDNCEHCITEDLKRSFNREKRKNFGKKFNRRMCSWVRGVLDEAVEQVCKQRHACHTRVNPAYTSQIDSTDGLLHGRREGRKFYRENGEVIDADTNGARNIRQRLYDTEIKLDTPPQVVKLILEKRLLRNLTSDVTERQKASVDHLSKSKDILSCAQEQGRDGDRPEKVFRRSAE